MKTRFFLLIFFGVLLLTHGAISATWTDPGTSNNAFDFSATTVSESSHHPGMMGQAQYWRVYGSASITGTANALNDGDEYECTLWLKASADVGSSPIPGKGRVNMSAMSGSIYYDRHDEGDAGILHKKHNVGSASDSAYLPLYTRNSLQDSLSYSYSKRNYTSPTGLCADPQVSGTLSGEILKLMGGGAGVLESLSCSSEPNKACATSPESSDTQVAAEICQRKGSCRKPKTATTSTSHQVKCPEQVRVRDDKWSFSLEAFGVTKYKRQPCGGSWWTCDELADKCPLAHNHLKPGEGSWGTSWYVDNETGARVSQAACGHYYASKYADNHRSVSYPCGSHSYYACQTPSTSSHSLQASCSSSNSNGNCTVTNFYACQSHSHSYPSSSPVYTPPSSPTPTPTPTPPSSTTVACGGASYTGCSGAPSRTAHHVPLCSNGCGNGYWTCSATAVRNHETSFTCRRCGTSFTRCSNGACSSGYPYHWAQ